jgi:hypothetical protein
MFIWDYAANPVMESIMDWCYSQIVPGGARDYEGSRESLLLSGAACYSKRMGGSAVQSVGRKRPGQLPVG